jgi:hypothetical protein
MKRKIAITAAGTTLALAALAAAPGGSAPKLPGVPARAQAAVSKSLAGGGGGNVAGAGNRLGNLMSGWAVPVLIVLAGCLLVGTLASRNIGASVGIVVISLIGLIFLLAPASVESLAKEIANTVL